LMTLLRSSTTREDRLIGAALGQGSRKSRIRRTEAEAPPRKMTCIAAPGKGFERLMGDLSDEFLQMSQAVESLTVEGNRLRRENHELHELIACGLKQVGALKTSSLEEEPTQALDICDAESSGRSSARELAAETTPRSHWTLNSGGDKAGSEVSATGNGPHVIATGKVKNLNGDSPIINPSIGSTDSSADEQENETEQDENMSEERMAILREQFDRLDKDGKGMLSAQDCWGVVAHIENQKYGHAMHEFKRVVRTVHHISTERRLSVDRSTCIDAGMDFEVFKAFMAREESDPRIMGEDTSYLRKAFEMEANEYLTKVARQNIAARHRQLKDPEPTGILKILLETLPPIVICINAIVIGIQNDIQSRVWEILEKIFLGFYTLEFLLKMKMLGCKRYFRGAEGRWNTFDVICLSTSIFDLSLEIVSMVVEDNTSTNSTLLPMLKVVRLARLARIVRSFRYKIFEDLKSMVSGVFSGARVLGWSIVLLFTVVYMLGVLMRQVVGNEPEFRNIPSAMFTVFRCFTDGCTAYNGTPLQERLRMDLEMLGYGGIFMIGYILMFLIVTVGVFNLIMAIFIDNVVTTTVKRKQQELGAREDEMKVNIEEMLIHLVRTTAMETCSALRTRTDRTKDVRISTGGLSAAASVEQRARTAAEGMAQLRATDCLITRDLFNAWLTDPDMLALLDDMEIDTATKFEIFDVCDVDKSGSLTADELVSGLLRLRGPISKCDIIAVRLKVRYLTDMLEDIHNSLDL